VALQSLHATNAADLARINVVVLHEGLGDQSRRRIDRQAEALGISVRLHRAQLPDLPYNTAFGGSRANYLRLALPDAVAGAERALYLDADIVVCAPVALLAEANLDGLPVGAVRDSINPTLATGSALPNWSDLGLTGDQEYFNSGVMVLDLAACARDEIFDRAFRAVAEHSAHLRLWDQDALNLSVRDRWFRLPRQWNSIPYSALSRVPWIRYRAEEIQPAAELIAAENDAAIMHYVSPSKPWLGLLPDGPANDLYHRHLRSVLRNDLGSSSERKRND
jgi:lipopolysaccharide biosynthesis glycosyltransferase